MLVATIHPGEYTYAMHDLKFNALFAISLYNLQCMKKITEVLERVV